MDIIRTLIVDDHRLFAEALAGLLDGESQIEVIGTAGTAEEGLDRLARQQVEVVVMDVDLPGMNGAEATRRLHEIDPGVAVVVTSGIHDVDAIADAIEAGASAFVPKTRAPADLVAAIERAAHGEVVMPAETAARVFDRLEESRRHRGRLDSLREWLTPRELEILRAMVEGESTKAIARTLTISPMTVRSHVRNVLFKLGVHSRLEAVAEAHRHGLVPEPTPHAETTADP